MVMMMVSEPELRVEGIAADHAVEAMSSSASPAWLP